MSSNPKPTGGVLVKHKVKPGDTLTSIAKQHGVTLQALEGANPQIKNINKIKIGQVVNVPASLVTETAATNPTETGTGTQPTTTTTTTVTTIPTVGKVFTDVPKGASVEFRRAFNAIQDAAGDEAEALGLFWGARFSGIVDTPHIQLLAQTDMAPSECLKIFRKNGDSLDAVWAEAEKRVKPLTG